MQSMIGTHVNYLVAIVHPCVRTGNKQCVNVCAVRTVEPLRERQGHSAHTKEQDCRQKNAHFQGCVILVCFLFEFHNNISMTLPHHHNTNSSSEAFEAKFLPIYMYTRSNSSMTSQLALGKIDSFFFLYACSSKLHKEKQYQFHVTAQSGGQKSARTSSCVILTSNETNDRPARSGKKQTVLCVCVDSKFTELDNTASYTCKNSKYIHAFGENV